MSEVRKITVRGFFGDKEVTEVEFINEWSGHMTQLHNLSWEHKDEFDKMTQRVTQIAAGEFQRLYQVQEQRKAS